MPEIDLFVYYMPQTKFFFKKLSPVNRIWKSMVLSHAFSSKIKSQSD